jgi:hypothetical protein
VLRAVGLGVLLALSVAGPAAAKSTPYFSVEISPTQPVAGQPIVVIVRTWADVAQTVPARLDTGAALDGLLVLRAAAGNVPDLAIALDYQALDEFRATVVAPTPGDWKLVAFPDRTGWASPDVPPGYPDTIALTVRAQSDGVSPIAAMAGLAALTGILGVVVILIRRGRRPAVIRSSNPG